MPGSNARAMEKAKSLTADAVIFDLEDAVAPDAKEGARAQVIAAVSGGGYGRREVIVRVNASATPWGRADLAAVATSGADGCFQMTAGEVAVARRLGLSLPIVVLDDGWLSLIQVKQARRGLAFYGTDLGEHAHVDPPAHYFGVPAVAAGSAAELARALQTALAADHPTVIEARVDPRPYLDTVYD